MPSERQWDHLLEGLKVAVSLDGMKVSREQLVERMRILQRGLGTFRKRREGERIEAGDDLIVDVLTYSGKDLIPFGNRDRVFLELLPGQDSPAIFPGFCEALCGCPTGTMVQIAVRLPPDYRVAALRGRAVSLKVNVREAHQSILPADSDSDAFWRAAKRGESLDQVTSSVLSELEENLLRRARWGAQRKVLQQLAARANVSVRAEEVDAQVAQLWTRDEGELLARYQVPGRERARMRQAWIDDPELRGEMSLRCQITAILQSIVAAHGLSANLHDVEDPNAPAEPRGQRLNADLLESLFRTTVVQYVISYASIEYLRGGVVVASHRPTRGAAGARRENVRGP